MVLTGWNTGMMQSLNSRSMNCKHSPMQVWLKNSPLLVEEKIFPFQKWKSSCNWTNDAIHHLLITAHCSYLIVNSLGRKNCAPYQKMANLDTGLMKTADWIRRRLAHQGEIKCWAAFHRRVSGWASPNFWTALDIGFYSDAAFHWPRRAVLRMAALDR